MSKAFDTIDHAILLNKIRYYGIDGINPKLIQSYLEKRTQYIQIDDSKSKAEIVETSIPQRSILGSLLFKIYMDDICNVNYQQARTKQNN